MKKTFIISLLVSVVFMFTGALFKLMHWPFASILLITGLITSIVYTVVGLTITISLKNVSLIEKGLWSIGFIFLSTITGLLFYTTKLKHVS